MKHQSAQEVKALLSGSAEVAFIDVRENADYGKGHPFFVSHIPYSVLEARIGLYVPRKGTTTVLIDNGDGVSEKAAQRLKEQGYKDVIVLKGGVRSWKDAGYALYEGISAPSKSFGEVVEHELGTKSITAKELKARMDAGDDNFLLLDGRTPEEFSRMTIPTSTSCPNAELGLRYQAMMARPSQDIIVNCAGRTRSLIGAQALNLLDLPNKIYALENGTMGWKLAGFELEHGATRSYPEDLPNDVIVVAEEKADELIKKYQIGVIDMETLSSWKEEDKTTFMFDIRTAEEYEAGHPDGFRHAPGGQLVQATDQWFATRNGRIVLFDQYKIRAAITAIWLKGMGHNAVLLDPGSVTELVHIGEFEIDISGLTLIDAKELKNQMEGNVTIVDVRSSNDYRESHVDGAIWSIRPKLGTLDIQGDIIIIASELLTATYALKDLGGVGSISLTEPDDWQQAGIDLVSTPDSPPDEDRIDFLFHTHERHSGNMEHAREYLRWETGLLNQMDEQEKSTLNPLKP